MEKRKSPPLPSRNKTIYVIAGPTAGGKSARAIEVARQENGVIINADSMQIYDALPVLAAQPPEEDKQVAPHLLYGILHPNEHCSAGIWRTMAVAEIENAWANGQAPIIVGGNGMYLKTLMEGLSPMPEVPNDIREATNALHRELGNPGFYEELKKRDPGIAARFHPNHTARLIRAWEVLEATGRSLADWQAESKDAPPDDWDFKIEVIMPKRDVLMARCDTRFEQMLERGALDETEDLKNKIECGDVNPKSLITKALGFKALCAHIDGAISKEEAVEKAKTQTRQYAKRQTTWFKNQL